MGGWGRGGGRGCQRDTVSRVNTSLQVVGNKDAVFQTLCSNVDSIMLAAEYFAMFLFPPVSDVLASVTLQQQRRHAKINSSNCLLFK